MSDVPEVPEQLQPDAEAAEDHPLRPRQVGAGDDTVQRLVAVLIMLVTLTGALFGYLQIRAGNRAASAGRRAGAESVAGTASVVRASQYTFRETLAIRLWSDYRSLRMQLDGAAGRGGVDAAFARALARADEAAENEAASLSEVLAGNAFDLPDGEIDLARFLQESFRGTYVAGEMEQVHRREGGGWGSKASSFVAILTAFALAVFLIGLTLTVPKGTRVLFLAAGTVVAVSATAWGISVWRRPVLEPSRPAVEAFVDGQVIMTTADDPSDFPRAEALFTDAIRLDPAYAVAYVGRGTARFQIDVSDPAGPRGSVPAIEDFQRAIALGRDDYVSWGNLGAAQWWHGEYAAATENTRRAFALAPRDITMALNYAVTLITSEGPQSSEVGAQLQHVRSLLESAPSLVRETRISTFLGALDLAIRHRPPLAEALQVLKDALLRMQQELGGPESAPAS